MPSDVRGRLRTKHMLTGLTELAGRVAELLHILYKNVNLYIFTGDRKCYTDVGMQKL